VRFRECLLKGAFVVELEPHVDERGFFARTFAEEEFAAHGLPVRFPQLNLSRNTHAGTLRGLHFNASPWGEAKVVRCTSGAIWDVIVDLRTSQPSYGRWHAVVLSAENRHLLYVPKGLAHGFQTLTDDVEFAYQISAPYSAAHAAGVRWNDSAFGIAWPETENRILSPADRSWPSLEEAA
jgi:dTDP-4-dehydrorhamnose 3,5-epimerase